MPNVTTVHDGHDTYREVTTTDETHRFEIVGDESTPDGYEYAGDGDAPEEATEALRAWIDEHHGDESGEEDVDNGSPEE
jgi:hypothetical protein